MFSGFRIPDPTFSIPDPNFFYPGSELFFNPGSEFFPSRIRIKEFKNFHLFYSVADPDPGSIRCLFDPWIRDPGWVESQHPDPGSGMNNPDHIC